MDIPFGFVGKILSWVWQRVTKLLMHAVYIESHRRWNSHHRLGSFWTPLGKHLEYSLRIAQPTDPEPKISKVALRSVEHSLASVDVYFEAYGAGIRYQEKLSLCDVDRRPIICSLLNIPVQDFLSFPGGGLSFSIEEVQFRQCVVKLPNGEILQPIDSMRAYLSHSWLLSDDWSYMWGRWWNCNAIKFAKSELSIYWRFCFGLPRVRTYSPIPMASYRKPFVQSVLQAIGQVLALQPFVTAQFWLAIWSGLFVMDKDDRLCFRWGDKGREIAESKKLV